jgi:16S rRNA (adenine1518-N6/adenine1519-N6)-dimethyltransferase
MKQRSAVHGIRIKKKFGQHFLRDESVLQNIVNQCNLDGASVFEIGCGDGALTRVILESTLARLWVFEIDPAWASLVRDKFPDPRLQIFVEDILSIDFNRFAEHQPWVLLANLPYQITFPILYRLHEFRHLLREGVIMIQEEVAHKIVANRGRGYGFSSLFFQHYFEWRLLEKVPPTAFYPPPKVFSRLLYFKPRQSVEQIPDEAAFWTFIKICFKQPRRKLKNNLAQAQYDLAKIPDELLALRAQQMDFKALLALWHMIIDK